MYICVWVLSHVQLFVTPWTVAHKTPLSMKFSRQEYLSGLPFPPPGDLPNPGIKLASNSLPLHHLASHIIAKSLQSCPTLYDPIPGILQARTLERVAISFRNA